MTPAVESASWRIWIIGARPRTLGAAIAPVVLGTAAAAPIASTIWWRAVLALVVALALQVGVNYANDYSDGVRGTDDARTGPVRLTATGLASPRAVKTAAWCAFGAAAIAGGTLAIAVDWRLLGIGVFCIAAAWLYTGGPKPYGYSGFGELMVLVCFGFVATCGSAYVQITTIPWAAWWGSLVVGLQACAILLANNIRDIPTDTAVGKRTLAVRIGAARARALFVVALLGAFVGVALIGLRYPWAFLGFAAAPLVIAPIRAVVSGREPIALIRALVGVGRAELITAVLCAIGLYLS
ncbi:MAG: 1,4-dihydroxy-2-naphthoate polyprenyltransferase [Acidimicrobiia bacterium]